MAQSDMTIQNQSFPSFRSDLNDALSAINSMHSGTSRPSSAVAGTMWLDTTNATSPTIKFFDGTDDIDFATVDYSANTINFIDSSVSFDIVNDTTPQLGGMLDVNGNAIGNGTEELIKFSETASAVNEVTVTNSATGNAPELSATGDDTNIDFKLTPKGTGKLVLDGLNFPTADGTTGQFLKTDGSGNLSFDDAGGGITMADQWRLTANQASGTNGVITSNLERVDTGGYGQLGTGLTESSGIFSFPETGIYFISLIAYFALNGGDGGANISIDTTTDNSNYIDACLATGGHPTGTETLFSVANHVIFDVTNTSTHKFRLRTHSIGGSTTVQGETDRNRTAVTVIRLGDT